jgi:Domain of unknown function (DUF4037)
VPRFVPGVELSRAFYEEVVAPLLAGEEHAAALLGTGSDVLGYDTVRSTDHGWGPRMQLFVDDDRVAAVRESIDAGLPEEFRGWPTRYGWDEVAVSHHVDVAPLGEWLQGRLGFDPCGGISTGQWLATPQQILLELTSGGVFHDPGGDLAAVRAALAWYPDDVWPWLLACQWRRLDQEEPFVGRTAEVGDELGSRVVASRLVCDCMRLAFLLERRYAPYSKWLGTAFAQLDSAAALQSPLLDVLSAQSYEARESAFVAVVEELARLHNASGATRPAETTVRLFYTRPFRVLGSARFVDACLERVTDPWLKSLPLVGAIDQFVDSADVLSDPRVFGRVGTLFVT